MVDPDRTAEREAVAARMDKAARLAAICVIPLALIAAVDLASGSLLDDKRIDLVLLAATAMALWGLFSIGGVTRRIRSGEPAERLSTAGWIAVVASCFLTLAFTAGVGFLLGGRLLAVVLVSFVIVLTGWSVARGKRRRRRGASGSTR